MPVIPYFFTMLMSTMFSDINTRLSTPKQKEPFEGITVAAILYADDTLTFGDHTPSINRLLKEIERVSSYYNMKLNYGKCVNMRSLYKKLQACSEVTLIGGKMNLMDGHSVCDEASRTGAGLLTPA